MADKSTLAFRTLIMLCVGLALAELAVHRHAYFALEATPFFFVLYGLICLAAALLIGAVLARLVARPLTYHDADMQRDMQEDGDA